MRILQVTNIVSPHQIPLAKQLVSIVGERNFRFAAMAPANPERLRLGWNMEADRSWILRPNEFVTDMAQFNYWWYDADVVLCGERLFYQMSQRIARTKLCFYMSERWWKPPLGRTRLLWPKFFQLAQEFRHLSKMQNFHYLSIGPFAARDITTLVKSKDRIWQWGYFTDPPPHESVLSISTDKLRVLWVGRMLSWKRVDILIDAVAALNNSGVSIELTLVGAGPKRPDLERLAHRKLGRNVVKFVDPVSSSNIINLMQEHDVYVLPSNAYEGWGAVINEAMSAKLAVVASDQAGAAAAMIDHGVNGLLFESGNRRDLEVCLRRLNDDTQFRIKLANSAQKKITGLWSPCVAAERLVNFSEELIKENKPLHYVDGPLSSAVNVSSSGMAGFKNI